MNMRARLDKWWLLPVGILAASAPVSLNVVVFGPSFVAGRSPAEPLPWRPPGRAKPEELAAGAPEPWRPTTPPATRNTTMLW